MRATRHHTDILLLADVNLVSRERVGKKECALGQWFSRIKHENAESVIVVTVVVEGTSFGQFDSHLVPSLQVTGQNYRGTVLLVSCIYFFGSCNYMAVNLQNGTGVQGVARNPGVTVDGEGEAVDTGARNSEDTGRRIVAITQIDEDVFVTDDFVQYELAKPKVTGINQSNRDGNAAGWKCKGELKVRKSKSLSFLYHEEKS